MRTEQIKILGAPLEHGAGRAGCTMGPSAYRVAGLVDALRAQGHEVTDLGDADPGIQAGADAWTQTAAWSRTLRMQSRQIAASGHFPIFLGGDHSMAMGTVPGLADYAASIDRPLFVLWLDAHADFNTAHSSPTGNIHGMPVACMCGLPGFDGVFDLPLEHPVDPTRICMIGIRSVDPIERRLVREHDVCVHDMRDVDEHGVAALVQRFLERVRAENGLLHVSLDVDCLDPDIAPAVGTTVQGGINYREAHLIMEMLCESGLATSLDLAELNPFLDVRGKTATLMVELVASLFGRRIMQASGLSSLAAQ